MGIPVESTGKNTLIPLADKYLVVKALLEYRKLAKAVASFTEKLPKHINPITGRIHSDYNQYGAATGRFSCSNPNLQQVPRGKDIRSCFVPTPGKKLVVADYSQIELRVAAEISGDRTMITAYQEGQDLHCLTASLITGKPLGEISKAQRQAGKPVNFGLIYGCGAKKLGQTAENDYGVVKPLEEWKTYRKQFFKVYKGIARWHSQLERDRPIEIRTLSNRRRQWSECPWVTATSNSIVQGTAADITKKALALLPSALAGTGAKLIGTVHDEILLECPETTASNAARILQEVMVTAGETYLKRVPVEVEVKVAESWADK
jgi:DNA polymerase-1